MSTSQPRSMPRPPARHRRRRRGGFTLLELMFSLVIGAIALTALYAVVGGSTRLFHEQHRLARMQVSLRRALTMVSRDVQRAGFLSTPAAVMPGESCNPVAGVSAPLVDSVAQQFRFAGVAGWGEELPAVTGLLSALNNLAEPPWAGLPPDAAMLQRSDTITLLGNYETNSEYTGIQLFTDNQTIQINSTWHAFQRDFTTWSTAPGVPDLDMSAFTEAFQVGRAIRILTTSGQKHFAVVTAVIAPGAGVCPGGVNPWDRGPCLRFSPAVPNACRQDVAGGWVAPLSFIRYRVRPAAGVEAPRDNPPVITGPNTQLQRVEMDPTNPGVPLQAGIPLVDTSNRSVLDYVAFFNVFFLANSAFGPGVDDTVDRAMRFNPMNNPERVRSAVIELAARAPTHDPGFPWPGLGDPVQRFLVFNDGRPGAARVRYARAEVFIPNVAYSGF